MLPQTSLAGCLTILVICAVASIQSALVSQQDAFLAGAELVPPAQPVATITSPNIVAPQTGDTKIQDTAVNKPAIAPTVAAEGPSPTITKTLFAVSEQKPVGTDGSPAGEKQLVAVVPDGAKPQAIPPAGNPGSPPSEQQPQKPQPQAPQEAGSKPSRPKLGGGLHPLPRRRGY